MDRIVIVGAGSPLVTDLEETCHRAGVDVAAIVRGTRGQDLAIDRSRLVSPDELTPELAGLPMLTPMFTPGERQAAYRDLLAHLPAGARLRFATLVDPTAITARSASFGAGTYVNAGAIVGACSVFGPHCMINRGAVLGHHLEVEDHVAIGPGAVVQGDAILRRGAMIGTNATIREYVTIGANAAVGAGAVVIRDVPPHTLVVGNPARVIREIDGYKDVPVR